MAAKMELARIGDYRSEDVDIEPTIAKQASKRKVPSFFCGIGYVLII
jgi:hypothetical protein